MIRRFFNMVLLVFLPAGLFAVQPAADNPGGYIPLLTGKRVAVVVNHSSTFRDSIHLVDYLIHRGIDVKRIFAPEHGYLGKAGAGESVADGKDEQKNIDVVSLYGKKKKPSANDFKDIDVVVFDIQDVGVRFYTYISTLTYVMDRAGEVGVDVIVLDRPNPHRHYVDGPVLDTTTFKSFVGLHPVPVVYGLTIGEYATMVNGEKWINNPCALNVVYCRNYNVMERYELPIPPSPNLPNQNAIRLYPSLCFFEGTPVSVGRGTDLPFQVVGAPWFSEGDFHFTPQPNEGAPNPKFNGEQCRGFNLTTFSEAFLDKEPRLYIGWLVAALNDYPEHKESFFTSFFNLLAGSDQFKNDLLTGKNEQLIRQGWLPDIQNYMTIRSKYAYYD